MGARNTLSWIRCDLCGRRMKGGYCTLSGRRMALCPYCMRALRGLGYCGGSKRARPRQASARGPSSSLLKRLGAD